MLETNYTQVPNPILDVIGEMSESELKLTMCIVRYTFGYHTNRAQMTYEIMQERTGMSRGAVYRAIELIEKRGFFRRGRKSFWFINSSEFELCYANQPGNSSKSERKSAGKSSDSEPTKRKEEKENNNGDVFDFYQNNIGGLSQMVNDLLGDAIDTYGAVIVLEAMQEAVKSNVRRWNYIEAILKNWKQNGRVKPSANGHNGNGAASPDVWGIALAHARRGDPNFTDEALKTAVRIFGWPKLQTIKPGDENFHRKEFLRIYNEQSTPTA